MYSHDPRIKDLPCEPEDLVRVYRSMNMVKISFDDHTSEPCETYVVTSRAPGSPLGSPTGSPTGSNVSGGNVQLQTHIVFYLDSPAVRAIYSYEGNPYPQSRRIEAESAAADMVEQMGAILEDTGWESMSPTARVQWLAQEYLFRLGEKRPRPKGPGGGVEAVTPPKQPDAAREVTGLETDFDTLLDSAFFEGGSVASAPSPAPAPAPAKAGSAAAAPPIEGPRTAPPPRVAPPAKVPSPAPVAPPVFAPPAASSPGGGAQARRACRVLAGF